MINIIRTKASMILNTFIDSPVCIGKNMGLPVKHRQLTRPDASRLEVLTKVKDERGKHNGSYFLFPRSEGYNFMSNIMPDFPTLTDLELEIQQLRISLKASHNFSERF